jgi:hypothetical protein
MSRGQSTGGQQEDYWANISRDDGLWLGFAVQVIFAFRWDKGGLVAAVLSLA